jgi:hypothetical protein
VAKSGSEKAITANLGCGTLILIAVIVNLFARGGIKDIEYELSRLSEEVNSLTTAVQKQSEDVKQLRALIEPQRPASSKPATPTTPSEAKPPDAEKPVETDPAKAPATPVEAKPPVDEKPGEKDTPKTPATPGETKPPGSGKAVEKDPPKP